MLYLGIDPGITGCCAVLDGDTNEVEFLDTPTVQIKVGKTLKNEQNAAQIVLMLQAITANREALVTIEKVQAMPGGGERTMGATSAFNFGKGFGMWLGILAALQLPFEQVHPATWKAGMMRGANKDKDASRVRAMEMFPRVSKHLSLKKHHGRADALLLAAWGRKQHENPMRAIKQEELRMDRGLFG